MNEPRLPDALLDKFTVDEIMCVIDWFVNRIERQSPKRVAELRASMGARYQHGRFDPGQFPRCCRRGTDSDHTLEPFQAGECRLLSSHRQALVGPGEFLHVREPPTHDTSRPRDRRVGWAARHAGQAMAGGQRASMTFCNRT